MAMRRTYLCERCGAVLRDDAIKMAFDARYELRPSCPKCRSFSLTVVDRERI